MLNNTTNAQRNASTSRNSTVLHQTLHVLAHTLLRILCTRYTSDVPDFCQKIAFYRQQNHVAAESKIQDASSEIWSGNLELVAVPLLLALAFGRLDADLLVVLLQRCKILTRLGELAL